MVMARRPVDVGRRGTRRAPRMLLVALALTVLVLAVTSIVSTSARGPDPAVTYADEVRPDVDRSTRQAAAVADLLRERVGRLPAAALRQTTDRLVREARGLVADVQAVDPPGSLVVAHGLLVTSLSTRATALATLRATLTADSSAPVDAAVGALVDAGRDLAVSDRSYELFLDALPPAARRTMPASTWVTDEDRWGRPEMAALVSTVRASASSAPVHDVAIVTVTPTPAPVAAEGDAQVLPRSKTILLDVVVANAGNTPEKRVAVEAVATSAGGIDTARQFADLQPGQRETVRLTVHPAAGANLGIAVKVVPVAGESRVADNERPLTYVVR
jgi:hypothetical protein